MKCKNCGYEVTEEERQRLRKMINSLKDLLEPLQVKQMCQKNGFCDVFCEQKYHGDL